MFKLNELTCCPEKKGQQEGRLGGRRRLQPGREPVREGAPTPQGGATEGVQVIVQRNGGQRQKEDDIG